MVIAATKSHTQAEAPSIKLLLSLYIDLAERMVASRLGCGEKKRLAVQRGIRNRQRGRLGRPLARGNVELGRSRFLPLAPGHESYARERDQGVARSHHGPTLPRHLPGMRGIGATLLAINPKIRISV